jgi:hypothetical protein
VAAGDIVQNSLWPSMRQPDLVRVASVPGRVRSWPGSLMAAARTTPFRRIRSSDAATALHVEHGDEVHVHPDGDGCVAAGEAARRHDQVVSRRDPEPAELDGDRRSEVAGPLECLDRLERVRAVTVVVGRTGGEPPGELLGDRHETSAGVGMSCQLDWHGAAQSVATSTATGTPLVTMS